MNVQDLIKENNEKRELLHVPNKIYYEQLLVYIRTKLSLSEQKTEEVLMDMLDHLLEAQADGKSATDVFGDDPKAYADDVIEQIPDEEKRDMVKFWGRMAFQLIAYYFIARGVILFALDSFGEAPDTRIYLLPSLIQLAVMIGVVWIAVRLLMRQLNKAAFTEETKTSRWKEFAGAGTVGALGFAIIAVVNWVLPYFGPSMDFPPASSIGIGAVLLLVSWVLKRTEWRS
ncbi:hypothetical protein CQS04_05750 [Chryseomicrobium excrementi]|uniref:DUF1129 domain-containing protein n=1 Tax=Chryseomicrobium excrementi TaxID=2041346 RepID=A0A2M9EZM4_9BACL|nr:DUF1129 family protein [Chryseomicrobium excrementi]PJK16661.1 hypothetical protein CQS04_05750 [Chryseomicrobium excrementi]